MDFDLETTQSSNVPAGGVDVTLRQRPSGRFGQSVFVTPTDNLASDRYPNLPSLLELSDDEGDDELTDEFANTLEEEFFPAANQVLEKQEKGPVIYLLSFSVQMLSFYF
jgi:hypothetical protein